MIAVIWSTFALSSAALARSVDFKFEQNRPQKRIDEDKACLKIVQVIVPDAKPADNRQKYAAYGYDLRYELHKFSKSILAVWLQLKNWEYFAIDYLIDLQTMIFNFPEQALQV